MNVITLPKYVLVLLIFLILVACGVIGVLFVRIDTAEESDTKTTEILDVDEECLEKEFQEIAWEDLESINQIQNSHSYGAVMTIKRYNENRTDLGTCKFYITDYIEEALGVSNSEIGTLTNIIYIGGATIAYQYHDAIYVQELEDGAKAVKVVDQSLASNTSLKDAGEKLIITGPFPTDDGQKHGITTMGRFLFTVGFTYSCENPASPRSCTEMIPLSKELKEKGVVGWWLYRGYNNGEIVLLSGEVETD